jgi:hypothetical protein
MSPHSLLYLGAPTPWSSLEILDSCYLYVAFKVNAGLTPKDTPTSISKQSTEVLHQHYVAAFLINLDQQQ